MQKRKDNLSERYKYSDSFEPRKFVWFKRKTTIHGIRFYDFDASFTVFDECCLLPKMGITWKYRNWRIAVELTSRESFRAGYSESDRENSTRNDRREVVDTVESDVAGWFTSKYESGSLRENKQIGGAA